MSNDEGDFSPVNLAMAACRPEKARMREIWVEQVKGFSDLPSSDDAPLYLTLSGALGLDIQSLVDAGILSLNPNGSVATDCAAKVVAVERNSQAITQLKAAFPGLKVKETNIGDLFRGNSFFRFPDGSDENLCRSRVINLDLDEVFKEDPSGNFQFPVINWIEKLGQLHKKNPVLDWCLCLTLHGETQWDIELSNRVSQFLNDNFQFDPEFEESCRATVDQNVIDLIRDEALDAAQQPIAIQQKLLRVLIPKLISHRLRNQGWKIVTDYNLVYGGAMQRAPMYTCALSFSADEAAATTPNDNYRTSLRSILAKSGTINTEGDLKFEGE